MRTRSHGLAWIAAPALLLGVVAARAQDAPKPEEKPAATTYHFGTAVSRTNVVFESETSVETIHGVSHKIAGTASMDFAGGKGSASLSIPVDSLQTGIEKRDEHLRSETWMDAAKYPDIRFEAKSLKRTKEAPAGKKETWAYEGTLTIHGVTKDVKGEATVARVSEEDGKGLGAGSWIRVKAEFQVSLKEYKIEVPSQAAAKVNDTWDVKVDIAGTTAEPKKE